MHWVENSLKSIPFFIFCCTLCAQQWSILWRVASECMFFKSSFPVVPYLPVRSTLIRRGEFWAAAALHSKHFFSCVSYELIHPVASTIRRTMCTPLKHTVVSQMWHRWQKGQKTRTLDELLHSGRYSVKMLKNNYINIYIPIKSRCFHFWLIAAIWIDTFFKESKILSCKK